MKSQTKFIRSHKDRVREANRLRKELPDKISIVDREAIVEFLLLEDVVRLYENKLANSVHQDNQKTRAGKLARKNNIEQFAAILKIFETATEVAKALIDNGNYKAVWKAIPEHALMVASGKTKYLIKLREIAVTLLRTLSEEALAASGEAQKLDEDLNELEDHDANVRTVAGLPSFEEIDEVIKAVEVAIPYETKNSTNNKRPNIN